MIRVLSREQPIILIALGARFHSRLFSGDCLHSTAWPV